MTIINKPYMGDIYRYLKNGEGRKIGEAAFEGDTLCKDIIEKYKEHYFNRECAGRASELKEALKEYASSIREKTGSWPNNTPLSLRIRRKINIGSEASSTKAENDNEVVDVFTIPPG